MDNLQLKDSERVGSNCKLSFFFFFKKLDTAIQCEKAKKGPF